MLTATILIIAILPHQPNCSHFHFLFLLNRSGQLHLPAHLKGSAQMQRWIELRSEKNSYSLCHTIQAQKQTIPKRPCNMQHEKLSTKFQIVH